jgi:hypothetical protein
LGVKSFDRVARENFRHNPLLDSIIKFYIAALGNFG